MEVCVLDSFETHLARTSGFPGCPLSVSAHPVRNGCPVSRKHALPEYSRKSCGDGCTPLPSRLALAHSSWIKPSAFVVIPVSTRACQCVLAHLLCNRTPTRLALVTVRTLTLTNRGHDLRHALHSRVHFLMSAHARSIDRARTTLHRNVYVILSFFLHCLFR